MKKRRGVLEAMGHKVAICSAYDWAEFPIPALEFDSEVTRKIMRNFFEVLNDFASEAELKRAFNVFMAELKGGLGEAIRDFSSDLLFVHNILCLPIHPAATVAVAEFVREIELPCAAIHHDILSEGAYKFRPTCDFAQLVLDRYYPPQMPNIKHWTINSRNQKALEGKRVAASIIHDTMDFDDRLDPTTYARLRSELRTKHAIEPHDVVLFVATRIVPNKQIEVAGQLTATLGDLRQHLIGKRLYHGEVFSEKSRITLVLAGRPEVAFRDYQKKLFELFDGLGIPWMYVGDEVRPLRSEDEGFYALYPDMYSMADFVLYPTRWEGFGNQILEAFGAGLPVAVFKYPVFKEDIAPKGVEVVSLGDIGDEGSAGLFHIPDEILTRALREIMSILTTPEKYRGITQNNIEVAKQNFGFDVLRAHLDEAISWAHALKAQ
jgi:glycosyltransferase involved in cell wall biosynthesis